MSNTVNKAKQGGSARAAGGVASRRNLRNRASAPGRGRSAAELVRQSNRWRDTYNPLRGLVISRIVTLIEAADRGDYAELQLVMRKIERRYPVLKALQARKLGALEKLDWDIKVVDELPAGATAEMAEAQRKHLRGRYELVENLTDAFGQLALAEFRGYAILQKHRYIGGPHDGAMRELHWLPQYVFSRDGQFGDFYYNAESRFGIGLDSCATVLGEANRLGGEELPREDFLLREHDTPLYEIALIAFVNWAMGRKDWAAFVEIFGLPNSIVIMPTSIPPGKEDEYQAAAEKVADGVSGALPAGSDAKFPTASVRSQAPFKEFCDAQDADVVLAGTGGRLSMLTADKGGLGDGPAEEHADAFDELAQAEARRISEIFQRQFDALELEQEFPGQPVLAYFQLAAEDQDDANAIVERVVKLDGIGFRPDVEEISEKTGLKLADEGRPAVAQPVPAGFGGEQRRPQQQPPAPSTKREDEDEDEDEEQPPLRNRDSAIRNQPRLEVGGPQSALAEATVNDLAPFVQRLGRILDIADEEVQRQKLAEFLADAEQLQRDILADPQAARVLEGLIAQAMVNGMEGKPV
jgi:phage gp29-like protein